MKRHFLTILPLLVAFVAAAQPPITFKPGPAVGEDANIVMVTPVGCIPSGWGATPAHLNPNPNSPEISMHANSIGGLGCSEAFDKSLIRFSEINTVLPPGATINYAELRLYTLPTGTPNFGPNAVNVRRITGSNWAEASVTWSSAATAWGITAGSPTPAWSAAAPITSPSIPNSTGPNTPGMVAVDVTNDVIAFHGGSLATNTGWILELQTESRGRWMKFASSDHPNSALWPELYIDYTLPPCDPDFTWTTNTTWPALTYDFEAEHPGLSSSYNMVWTKNSVAFGSGATAQTVYSQQVMDSDEICLELYNMVTGDLECRTCLIFCHGDFSTTWAQGGCNSHFSVSGNTNTPDQITLTALNPTAPNTWRINGGTVGLTSPVTVPISSYYGTYYTVELDKGSGCKRWQGNLCNFENAPSGYRPLRTEEEITLEQLTENTQDALQIAPNPATDMVSIHLGRTHEDFVTVILTDVAGKVMYKAQHPVDKSAHTVNFSVAELPTAFYSVQVQNGTRMLHGKMVRK